MPAEAISQDPKRILRMRETARRTGLSRQTLWRLVRAGDFPQPIQLTSRSIGWPEAEVDAWLRAKRVPAERRADPRAVT